ncbi:hypothetical protein L1987_81797 [Smallanthus sonchifolius]|uniref:Uncharacterized protein n=1 Tax=Smallanthus sonchifolius TaxID=185202 RepID=A0ACB8YT20_9ASTR|nr:hypothetical protein L1987_81797 [Smallanthus sonchifolius]
MLKQRTWLLCLASEICMFNVLGGNDELGFELPMFLAPFKDSAHGLCFGTDCVNRILLDSSFRARRGTKL